MKFYGKNIDLKMQLGYKSIKFIRLLCFNLAQRFTKKNVLITILLPFILILYLRSLPFLDREERHNL